MKIHSIILPLFAIMSLGYSFPSGKLTPSDDGRDLFGAFPFGHSSQFPGFTFSNQFQNGYNSPLSTPYRGTVNQGEDAQVSQKNGKKSCGIFCTTFSNLPGGSSYTEEVISDGFVNTYKNVHKNANGVSVSISQSSSYTLGNEKKESDRKQEKSKEAETVLEENKSELAPEDIPENDKSASPEENIPKIDKADLEPENIQEADVSGVKQESIQKSDEPELKQENEELAQQTSRKNDDVLLKQQNINKKAELEPEQEGIHEDGKSELSQESIPENGKIDLAPEGIKENDESGLEPGNSPQNDDEKQEALDMFNTNVETGSAKDLEKFLGVGANDLFPEFPLEGFKDNNEEVAKNKQDPLNKFPEFDIREGKSEEERVSEKNDQLDKFPEVQVDEVENSPLDRFPEN